MTHRIVIVGGGFGGVTAALHLGKKRLKDTKVTLISDKLCLEYYGVLYRLIAGRAASEACIPLKMMLDTSVHIETDSIVAVDPIAKTVTGASGKSYFYDTLLLAPGSEPAYFNIPGMQEHSITMKSAAEALHIRKLVHDRVEQMAKAPESERATLGRFAVIGAGPTGCEIAGEVLPLARALCKKHHLSPSLIDVVLIEAMDRVLPTVEPDASAKVYKRLRHICVNVMLNQAVAKAAEGSIEFKDGKKLEAATIVWTAGVKAHSLIATIPGLELDRRGRAMVDEQLRAKGQPNIFILGDCAVTQYSGMAQTAYEDGKHATHVIEALQSSKNLPVYKPKAPAYAIPVGGYWAAVKFGPLRVYGLPGYVMRRAADVHVYMLIMPWLSIPLAYFGLIDLKKYGISDKR